MTIDEIAVMLEVDKPIAYGLMRFLEAKRLAQPAGTRKGASTRGKGSKMYALKPNALEGMEAILRLLPRLG